MVTKRTPTIDSGGKLLEKFIPTRLGDTALNATILDTITATIPPATFDGGNATSTYTGTFNIDGGSAA